MPALDRLEQWFTGIDNPRWARSGRPRIVVVEAARHAPRAVAAYGSGSATVWVRQEGAEEPVPAGSARDVVTFHGSFLADQGQITVPGRPHIDIRPYGVAELADITGPTVLRITDDEDFSAFLRDADRSRAGGPFPAHLTDRRVLLADLAGLGAPAERSGPADRLLIRPDGTVSTSPTGGRLGRVGDDPADLERQWRGHLAGSRRPCPVCLSGVLAERDRVDALAERPWLGDYLRAVEQRRWSPPVPAGGRPG
ncbi:daptide biosynthesis RiPP recognition protein [Nakamurella sp.]|uniref:daptide biosynthesis RiPP recognition protein n=1 Tax=Nakamurella sp. TaxID=1869182 RepID=UPI003B3B9CF5